MVPSAAAVGDGQEASAPPVPLSAFCRLQGYEIGFLALRCFPWVLWWLHSKCDGSFILIRFQLSLQVGSSYLLCQGAVDIEMPVGLCQCRKITRNTSEH